jgi:hypothetical protein
MYSETEYNAFMRDAMARLAHEGVGNARMRMAADMWSRAGGKPAEEVEEKQPADEEKQLQAEQPSIERQHKGRARRNTLDSYAGKRCPKDEVKKQEHLQKRDAWYAVQGTARMVSKKTSNAYSGTEYNAFLKATMTVLAKDGIHGGARMQMAAKLWRATKT